MGARTRAATAILLAAALCLAGCRGRSQAPDPVIATFAQGEVRQSDLDTWHSFLNVDGREGEGRLGLDALERHVVMRTLAREAIDAGLEEDPVARMRIRRAVDERLAASLREDVRESIEIPEERVERYLEGHRDELDKPERRVVSYIFRRAREGRPGDARAALEAARRRLLADEDFAALAAEVSESPTRLRGGRLGTVEPGMLPERLDRALFALAEGGVSEVLETGAGFALLRCDRVLPAYAMEPEEARRRVVQYFRRPRLDAAWEQLTARLTEGRIRHDLERLADPAAGPDTVVSTFGSQTLTRAEAEALLGPMAEEEAAAGNGAPRTEARARLERFAVNALLAQEARRRGLDETPERRRELHWVRLEQLSREQLRRKVDRMTTEPDEAALRRFYRDNAERYRRPDRYLLSIVRRPYSPESLEAAYRELVAMAEAARGGGREVFTPERGAAGASAWHARSEIAGWGATILRSVDELRPGEVTEPIQQGDELWLVRLLERRRGELRDFDEVRAEVSRDLAGRERRRLIRQVLRWTLGTAGLERRAIATGPKENSGKG